MDRQTILDYAGQIEMTDDYLMMDRVMQSHGVTVKQLAYEANCSEELVYKVRNGSRVCPIYLWRTLYRLTRDQRVIRLITGEVPTVVGDPLVTGGDVAAVRDHLPAMVRSVCRIYESIVGEKLQTEVQK